MICLAIVRAPIRLNEPISSRPAKGAGELTEGIRTESVHAAALSEAPLYSKKSLNGDLISLQPGGRWPHPRIRNPPAKTEPSHAFVTGFLQRFDDRVRAHAALTHVMLAASPCRVNAARAFESNVFRFRELRESVAERARLTPKSGAQQRDRLEVHVQIRLGYDLHYTFTQPTPIILTLNIHHSRAQDLVEPDRLQTEPAIPIRAYRDGFGNWCTRLVAPAGKLRIWSEALINDSGQPDLVVTSAPQVPVDQLPEDTLVYLLGSRYCETDLLSELAWRMFEHGPTGYQRVQAICDFVNRHIEFGYQYASPTKTAFGAYSERRGVCRDFAHLAITLCRCMNIPARYCTGYLGDIGVPPVDAPMDFAGWFEAYLGGAWYTFDPRNNVPRIGRVLIARGRDAADVAINTTFGPNTLDSFAVRADEVRPT
jgi:transglutaminase-like putative cysteine protease